MIFLGKSQILCRGEKDPSFISLIDITSAVCMKYQVSTLLGQNDLLVSVDTETNSVFLSWSGIHMSIFDDAKSCKAHTVQQLFFIFLFKNLACTD